MEFVGASSYLIISAGEIFESIVTGDTCVFTGLKPSKVPT